MSETAPVSTPEVVAVPVPAPAPAPEVVAVPAPAPVVPVAVAVVTDLANKSELVKLALTKVAEAEILSDRSDEDKAKFVVEEVKKAVRESSLSEELKTDIISWCDVALPYVVEAIKLVKAEVKKLAGTILVDMKKCCPTWFKRA
jgi:hypothetical protein